jgi:hypothetical protein
MDHGEWLQNAAGWYLRQFHGQFWECAVVFFCVCVSGEMEDDHSECAGGVVLTNV